jgi:hypothetical protein
MGSYNEGLVKAGVMLAGEGLQPSSKGVRVKFSGDKRTVTDGPFPETKELISGFWIWQVKSMADAIEWLKRAPFGSEAEIEIVRLLKQRISARTSRPNSANGSSACVIRLRERRRALFSFKRCITSHLLT